MPAKGNTPETAPEAIERFDDLLAFHYPTMTNPVMTDATMPASLLSRVADLFVDTLPVNGVAPNGWRL